MFRYLKDVILLDLFYFIHLKRFFNNICFIRFISFKNKLMKNICFIFYLTISICFLIIMLFYFMSQYNSAFFTNIIVQFMHLIIYF